MSENLESVMRRIEKLLAIARDTRANPNEAAAAASMAAKIMRKYQIDEAAVILAKLKAGEDMVVDFVIPTLADWKEPLLRVPRWAGQLAVSIALLTGTKAAYDVVRTTKGTEACVVFMGFRPDVQIATYMLKYLQTVMRALRVDYKQTYTYKQQGVASLRAYTAGLANGICEMLMEEFEKQRQEDIAAAGSVGTSLVVVKQNAVEERFGKMVTRQTKYEPTADGFVKGFTDGKNVKMKQGIEGTTAASENALAHNPQAAIQG